MAKKPRTTAFEADARYRIKVNRVVPFGAMKLKPAHDYTVTGRVAIALGEAIESAEKV